MSDPSTILLVAVNGVVALLSVFAGALVTYWTTTRSARRARVEKVYSDALAAVATVEGLAGEQTTERSLDGRAYKAAAIHARVALTHAAVFEPKLAPLIPSSDADYWWDAGAAPEIIKILAAALAK